MIVNRVVNSRVSNCLEEILQTFLVPVLMELVYDRITFGKRSCGVLLQSGSSLVILDNRTEVELMGLRLDNARVGVEMTVKDAYPNKLDRFMIHSRSIRYFTRSLYGRFSTA